jgi:hypothetical protein
MTMQQKIAEIIKKTFIRLSEIVNGKSSMILPYYYEDSEPVCQRISEQELRYAFIKELETEIESGLAVSYSIETPTRYRYRFSDDPSGLIKEVPYRYVSGSKDLKKLTKSGNIDLVIHPKGDPTKRLAIIEFKGNESTLIKYRKDFYKLEYEADTEDSLRYFIQVVSKDIKKTREDEIRGVIIDGINSGVEYFCFDFRDNKALALIKNLEEN